MHAQSILGLRLWLLVPLSYAITIVALAVTGLKVDGASLLSTIGIAALVAAVLAYYARHRADAVICGMLESFLFLLVVAPALGIMGYPLQALALPLWDKEFAELDAALGFDWIAHLTWVSAHPWIETTLVVAYRSCMIQLACCIMLLCFTKRFFRIREFLMLFTWTALIVAAVSALMPAEGAYPFHNPSADILIWGDAVIGTMHVDPVRALRAGEFGTINFNKVEGLVTLPSFHAIFAILLAWSLRDFKWLFIPAAIWNGVICLSAVAVGGHYLVDIIAGGMIAAAAMATYSAAARRAGHAIKDNATLAAPSYA